MWDFSPLIKAVAERGDVVLVALVLFGLIGAIVLFAVLRMLANTNNRQFLILENSMKVEAFLQAGVQENTRATEANTEAVSAMATQMQVHNQQMRDLLLHVARERKRQ